MTPPIRRGHRAATTPPLCITAVHPQRKRGRSRPAWPRRAAAALGVALSLVGATHATDDPPGARPAREPRAERSEARCDPVSGTLRQLAGPLERGTDFLRRLAGLGERERDAAIRDALLAGNLPSFLRRPVPIELHAEAGGRNGPRVTVCVLPDYLSVGTDDDHVLVPMSLDAALAVGNALGFTLPTRRLVDVIYAQARVRLSPQPMPPGDAMRTTAYFARHNDTVRAQRAAAGSPPDALAAGHKKDLVLTNRLWEVPGRLALYGWHRDARSPIQPLSIVHGARYADYSHGIRLVGATAFVDGAPRPIFEVLSDPRLAAALSDEGPIPRAAELHREAASAPSTAPLASAHRAGSDLQQRNPRW